MPLAKIPDLIPAMPELFMAAAIMTLLMLGVFQKRGADDQEVGSTRFISWLSVGTLVLTLVLVGTLSGERLIAFNNMFVSDAFAIFCKVLVLLGSALTLVIAREVSINFQ